MFFYGIISLLVLFSWFFFFVAIVRKWGLDKLSKKYSFIVSWNYCEINFGQVCLRTKMKK